MSFAVGISSVAILVTLLNLVLMAGVIKRLREHTELISTMRQGENVRPSIGVGEEVGDFAAMTLEGREISRGSIDGETLVGFFSPGCAPCEEKLPRFVQYCRSLPEGSRGAVAVVVSSDMATAEKFVTELSGAATVVLEPTNGPLSKAFRVLAYPTLVKVGPEAGRLIVTEEDVDLSVVSVART
ncbi:redoxin domain-containing protein [Streptosporangium sp. NPDC000239]|uniref:TlpA family protein disulfide reductase n=1 Tax=Streptosporangium sp. NPDC000239 TaxID=3154248 RepID=UPI00332F537A